ncbi:hypothetical protein JCM11641_003281 [Rhodosporidiobolus odoratus]
MTAPLPHRPPGLAFLARRLVLSSPTLVRLILLLIASSSSSLIPAGRPQWYHHIAFDARVNCTWAQTVDHIWRNDQDDVGVVLSRPEQARKWLEGTKQGRTREARKLVIRSGWNKAEGNQGKGRKWTASLMKQVLRGVDGVKELSVEVEACEGQVDVGVLAGKGWKDLERLSQSLPLSRSSCPGDTPQTVKLPFRLTDLTLSSSSSSASSTPDWSSTLLCISPTFLRTLTLTDPSALGIEELLPYFLSPSSATAAPGGAASKLEKLVLHSPVVPLGRGLILPAVVNPKTDPLTSLHTTLEKSSNTATKPSLKEIVLENDNCRGALGPWSALKLRHLGEKQGWKCTVSFAEDPARELDDVEEKTLATLFTAQTTLLATHPAEAHFTPILEAERNLAVVMCALQGMERDVTFLNLVDLHEGGERERRGDGDEGEGGGSKLMFL